MKPTKHRFEDLYFGVLGVVCALGLLLALILTGAVAIGGHPSSPKETPDSIRAATHFDTVATFVRVWETDEPLQFCAFVGAVLLAVCWLGRRSPWLVGFGLVAAWFILCMRMGLSGLG